MRRRLSGIVFERRVSGVGKPALQLSRGLTSQQSFSKKTGGWHRSTGRVASSPGGAVAISQGREPLEGRQASYKPWKGERSELWRSAKRRKPFALPGLAHL